MQQHRLLASEAPPQTDEWGLRLGIGLAPTLLEPAYSVAGVASASLPCKELADAQRPRDYSRSRVAVDHLYRPSLRERLPSEPPDGRATVAFHSQPSRPADSLASRASASPRSLRRVR